MKTNFYNYKIDVIPKKIIILLSTQRSGSTMICRDFKNTNVLGKPDEYFISLIKKVEKSGFSILDQEREEIGIEINERLLKSSTSNGVISFKLMSSYLHLLGQILSSQLINSKPKQELLRYQYQDTINSFFQAISNNNIYYVRIYRKDKIKQAISRLIASHTGIYHKEGKDSDNLKVISKGEKRDFKLENDYSYKRMKKIINSIIKEEQELDLFIARNKIKPMVITYENVVNNQNYLKDVAKFIELNSPIIALIKERKTVKLSNEINEEIYKKFMLDGGWNARDKYSSFKQKIKHYLKLWLRK
ncbi:bifunctional orotidine 5'-phosphate decarboxylase/orotate phosphoribosyltransferase [Crocosphaera chwakensis]|uniref:Bifunctional orotidine 5'-phosphate decarboxylase/orotate phosphoribosyltransferase protein n=1 Tax=Crocosphaera chwakensis CCY0110 TaxID=391612 RepID=A3IWD9_9CHRO|nr:bifunctional orotidine 5'-phosphate decarboxylase/orotate phosphoribosyltransferase [Crocosphaera chwakensis]EAZ89190.1 bifunctional orotidine 5'-phosphate decarboxylase/orotate phosphoribosyltransferase protein [Crocosphaera chwakensis CCY0110]